MPESGRQPALHDLVTCLRAPTTVLSGADGQLRGVGAHGIFVADLRVISSAVLTVGVGVPTAPAVEPEPVAGASLGADSIEFLAVIATPRHPVPDPALWVRRLRRAEPFGCTESLTVSSVLDIPTDLEVRLRVATDLAGIWAVRASRSLPARQWTPTPDGASFPTLRSRSPQGPRRGPMRTNGFRRRSRWPRTAQRSKSAGPFRWCRSRTSRCPGPCTAQTRTPWWVPPWKRAAWRRRRCAPTIAGSRRWSTLRWPTSTPCG